MSSKTPSPFLDEVLPVVASQLPIDDLRSLLQVNSACHRVAVAALRKAEAVDLLKDAATSPVTLNPSLSDTRYAQHVRCITVKPHMYGSRCKVALPQLPSLNKIRLYLNPDVMSSAGRLLHEDEELPQGQARRPWPLRDPSEVICPLLCLPGVETIVIAEAPELQGPEIKEVLPKETLSGVKNTVLFLSPDQTGTGTAINNEYHEGDPEHPTRMDLIVSFATPSTESFTLVYQYPQRIPFDVLAFGSGQVQTFEEAIQDPPLELIQGIFDLCQDIGKPPVLAAVPNLKLLTVVVPDGVFSQETRRYFVDKANSTIERYFEKKAAAVRVLAMSEFIEHKEYVGVLREEEKELWTKRYRLPHYNVTKEEIDGCISQAMQEIAGYGILVALMNGELQLTE